MARRWKADTLAEHARAYGWSVWHADRFAFLAHADPEWDRAVLVSWPDGQRQKTARIREGAEPRQVPGKSGKTKREGKVSAAKVAAYIEEFPGEYWGDEDTAWEAA